MDTRNLLIDEIVREIESLPMAKINIDTIPKQNKQIALLIQIESDMEMDKLRRLLAISENTVALHVFLQNRWQKIKNTDASYLISDSLINKSCLLMANKLQNTNDPPYDLLLPMDNTSSDVLIHENFRTLKLHELFLREDGSLLEVKKGLEYLENPDKYSELKPLTLEEERLIKHHSKEAESYMDALLLQADITEVKQQFLNAIKSDSYNITASYGEEGKQQLLSCILKEIQSTKDFVKLMVSFIPEKHWQLFLSTLLKENLFKLILEVDLNILKQQFKTTEDYKYMCLTKTDEAILNLLKKPIQLENENELRAFILCILETYKISRNEGPDFKSNTGYYLGYWFSMAFSKENKIKASDVFAEFVLTNAFLNNESLETFLKQKNVYEQCWAPLTSSSMFSSNILTSIVSATMAFATKLQHKQDNKIKALHV